MKRLRKRFRSFIFIILLLTTEKEVVFTVGIKKNDYIQVKEFDTEFWVENFIKLLVKFIEKVIRTKTKES